MITLIEKNIAKEKVLAIIIRKDFSQPGIHFVTSNDFSQQLAYMHHRIGKTVEPHIHIPVHREVTYIQEADVKN